MKKNILYLFGALCLVTSSCDDEFVNKLPETDLTIEGFFNTPNDLATYVNGLYSESILYARNTYSNEEFSDNTACVTESGDDYKMLRSTLTIDNVGGWSQSDWKVLRRINVMLANCHKATGNEEEINHSIGQARYFRAVFYISQMLKYSDVPWYNAPLQTTDEAVYKPQDPRALVADSIRADLEFAAAHIKADLGNRTVISKYAAQFLLARFCLYEGTWRKYHDELGLQSSAGAFLERAASAAQEIVSSNTFSITGKGRQGFSALFTSADLSGNNEIILMCEHTLGLGEGNSANYPLEPASYGMSRSLMETFLMNDGTRFTEKAGYDRKEWKDVFVDRDPRFYETFVPPGFVPAGKTEPYVIIISQGGYKSNKYYPRDASLLGAAGSWRQTYTDLPQYRYAEVLLTLAEAKAELGTVTQADIDATINKIRARVEMPAMSLSEANSNPDPVLAAQYPNVSGSNKGAILEIRRERRVELALEGQRLDDINRWKVGALMAQAPQGMYIPGLGAYDVTGDGQPDIAILQNSDDLSPIAHLTADQQKSVQKYYLDEWSASWYLSEGTKGYIMFTPDVSIARKWEEPKYYYRPIPITQINLNPALKQPYGW